MMTTQIRTANQLWKMSQIAPPRTKVGTIMTIPIPIFLAMSTFFLLE
jgi:hypothetical protein